jgi:hypothetical protein
MVGFRFMKFPGDIFGSDQVHKTSNAASRSFRKTAEAADIYGSLMSLSAQRTEVFEARSAPGKQIESLPKGFGTHHAYIARFQST